MHAIQWEATRSILSSNPFIIRGINYLKYFSWKVGLRSSLYWPRAWMAAYLTLGWESLRPILIILTKFYSLSIFKSSESWDMHIRIAFFHLQSPLWYWGISFASMMLTIFSYPTDKLNRSIRLRNRQTRALSVSNNSSLSMSSSE